MKQFIKKYLFYALALPLSLWLAILIGDGMISVEKREKERATYYTDPQTGCQYVSFGGVEGLAPRLDKDGKAICYDNVKK